MIKIARLPKSDSAFAELAFSIRLLAGALLATDV